MTQNRVHFFWQILFKKVSFTYFFQHFNIFDLYTVYTFLLKNQDHQTQVLTYMFCFPYRNKKRNVNVLLGSILKSVTTGRRLAHRQCTGGHSNSGLSGRKTKRYVSHTCPQYCSDIPLKAKNAFVIHLYLWLKSDGAESYRPNIN